ncbi:glycosyltransferase family 39 protein [Salinifilum aidingensis]
MPTTARTLGPRRDDGSAPADAQRKPLLDGLRAILAERFDRHRRAALVLAPAVVYLAVRGVGLLLLGWLSAANDQSAGENLASWDGEWYLEIAAHGYGGVDPAMVDGRGERHPETPLAFFPGFPLLVRLVSVLPGLGVLGAGIAVSLAAGVAGAWGLVRIGRAVSGSRAVGLLLVALFAAAPMSIVLSMAYSEALFCALAIWAMVGVLERDWLLAGLCCTAAGLVRPTAAALIGVVALAAITALLRGRDSWRPWQAVVLAPLGMLAYVCWVGLQTGNPTGYFALQRQGWSSEFDFGAATGSFALDTLSTESSVLETLTVWILLVALTLLVLCLRTRIPWPLVLFAAAVLVLDLGTDGLMYSKVRLMLPAFPLLIPVAIGLAHRRRTTAAATIAFVVLFGSWFGAYSLTAWSYAI